MLFINGFWLSGRIGLTVVLVFFFSGCAISKPSDKSQFFLLSAPDLASQSYSADTAGLVGVGPISFADYLKRSTIVIQQSANQYDIAKLDQWGGRLEDEFQLALLKNLLVNRPDKHFVAHSGMLAAQTVVQLKADIYRFDVTPQGQARIEASWAWVDRSNRMLAGGNYSARKDAGITLEQKISAMSDLVGLFAEEVSAKLPR
ncbi:MAG: membrane integrity-associated transporter subunit PqiC [Hahellaceae bacterium]|nr:membrane integrity-associated transporter subunit PqiC [Hahellaceae bacterium]MCP5212449.1 membrane integrity-associated transporter subunit PqiC [Hahellaceae bacterium]